MNRATLKEPGINGQNIRQLFESEGYEGATRKLCEALDWGLDRTHPKHRDGLRWEHLSLQEMAIGICGEQWYKKLNPHQLQGSHGRRIVNLQEAGEGVDVSAFSNIVGQFLYNKIREVWEEPGLIGDQLVTEMGTKFSGERIPFLSHIKDEGDVVHEGMPYPETSFGEHWIDTPQTLKYGRIVSITKETIFFDRTGQVGKRATELTTRLKFNKEKRILDTILGYINTFKWDGVTYNTYQTAGTYWTNVVLFNPLVDYTSVEKVEILSEQILDPDTGNPIVLDIEQSSILLPRSLVHTVQAIMRAEQVWRTNLAAVPNVRTISPNILQNYGFLTSPFVYQRQLANGQNQTYANSTWFMGQFKKAFSYYANWPITVEQAPPNSLPEFERDLVLRYRASERGTTVIEEPRYVFKCVAGATA